MEEDFKVGDLVNFGADHEQGEVVAVRDNTCVIEYFNKQGNLTTKEVDNALIFARDEDD